MADKALSGAGNMWKIRAVAVSRGFRNSIMALVWHIIVIILDVSFRPA